MAWIEILCTQQLMWGLQNQALFMDPAENIYVLRFERLTVTEPWRRPFK